MSVKNFKFVSPGVFINEIDNSFRPRSPEAIGPVVVGRASRGIAGEPITVESFSEFVDMFGDTVPGMGGGDIYRHGNFQSPMYGTYAAKAFLNGNVAPLTYMRLLGQQTDTNDGTDAGRAGWKTDNTLAADGSGAVETAPDSGGAFGLFLFPSGSGTKASAVLTFGSGIPSNGALEITFGTNGTFTLTFDNTAGSSDATIGTDKAATIDPSVHVDSAGS